MNSLNLNGHENESQPKDLLQEGEDGIDLAQHVLETSNIDEEDKLMFEDHDEESKEESKEEQR